MIHKHTFSDAYLDKRIAYIEAQLAKVRPGSWTAEQIQRNLDYHREQRALPRAERCKFTPGKL